MGDDNDILNQLQTEADELRQKNTQLNHAVSSATYQGQDDANLIQYQIDTGEMLGKIEHFLRGEYVAVDDDGNEFWAKPKKILMDKDGKPILNSKKEKQEVIDDSLILFNDYGVNSILSILGNYLDKNTILSYYDEMRINEILADLGDEISNFIFCNYEVMGMDTAFKKTRFQLTVITILHSVESAYRRALRGKTMEDLNSSKIFTQLDSIGNRQPTKTKSQFNLFKPATW